MIQNLIQFLKDSPVNYLAIQTLADRLDLMGFRHLDAGDRLEKLKAGDRVYFEKNDSALFAFEIGEKSLADAGIRLICAHCDSPTFRLKPNPTMLNMRSGIAKLDVEVYGGVILNSWFDRPLSLAGRIILKTKDIMHPNVQLIHIRRPLLTIPNLCIHLNRQVNDGLKISVQKEINPILGFIANTFEKEDILMQILCDECPCSPDQILDFDLYLYDVTEPCLFGANNEFISAGRLDDLSMVHAGLEAFLTCGCAPKTTRVLAVFDNEETGSQTKQGAASPFFASLVERLVAMQGGDREDYYRCIEHSFMISADNAHAYHPNYGEKYDPITAPVLGGGPVIKFNAAQKYASDAYSASIFAQICTLADVPYQKFVNHSDVAGGSTLGNILTSNFPVCGVDMGNPILAMHSVRETGSVTDHDNCIKAFRTFYNIIETSSKQD